MNPSPLSPNAQVVAAALGAGQGETTELKSSHQKMLAKLILTGTPIPECAKVLELTEVQVIAILNYSKEFQEELEAILKLQEDYSPKKLLNAFLPTAILTCASIMNDPKASSSDRLNAARELMNRTLGKPSESKNQTSEPLEQLNKLNREIAAAKQHRTTV